MHRDHPSQSWSWSKSSKHRRQQNLVEHDNCCNGNFHVDLQVRDGLHEGIGVLTGCHQGLKVPGPFGPRILATRLGQSRNDSLESRVDGSDTKIALVAC